MESEEKIYFKKRDGTLFKAITKEGIYNILDIYDFDMIKKYLEFMDYPWFPERWIHFIRIYGETPKILARYISYCNLKGILFLRYRDSHFCSSSVEELISENIRKEMDPDYYGS